MNMSIYFGYIEHVRCHLTEDGSISFVLLECFDLVFIYIFIIMLSSKFISYFTVYNLKKKKKWID